MQGKYRYGRASPEKRSDVMAFAALGRALTGDRKHFDALKERMDSVTLGRIERARSILRAPGAKLNLYFVTTGRVSSSLRSEAEHEASRSGATIQVFDRTRLVQLLHMYMEGAAPPVPTLEFPIQGKEIFSRFDARTGISSYLFSMEGRDLATLYDRVGIRLFARNIRGYLGRTKVNKQMRETVKSEPQYFWYFNNGVTVVADEAQVVEGMGKKKIRAHNS
ncbi:MAG: AIPR family protein, partial [Thermomicrobiales bacterium]